MPIRKTKAAFFFALILAATSSLGAADSTLTANKHAGEALDSLSVGPRTYTHVVVRSVTARSLSFTHDGGLASVALRDLSPELQARFGYDAATAAQADQRIAEAQAADARRVRDELQRNERAAAAKRVVSLQSKYEQLIQSFGTAPVLRQEVDLRQEFFKLDLAVKNQGRRPSCSVFAIVSALEFLNAQLSGKSEKLSEEYLIWATRKVTQRAAPETADGAPAGDEADIKDEGFSLDHVVSALRGYGIPLQSNMPNTFGTSMGDIATPAPEIIEEARARRRVFVQRVPGRDASAMVANFVHILNAGIPIPVGLRWPHYRTLRNGYLHQQPPILDYSHAVTIVGYQCKTGQLEDAVFIFKNSYGSYWGQGGYGFVTAHYLGKNLLGAALIEMQVGNAGN